MPSSCFAGPFRRPLTGPLLQIPMASGEHMRQYLLILLLSSPFAALAIPGSIEIPNDARPATDAGGCWNAALTLPTVGVRFIDRTVVSGPLPPLGLGLGAAYTVTCGRLPSFALNLFLFSESLD